MVCRGGAACRLDIAPYSSTSLKMEVGGGDRYPYKSEITNAAVEEMFSSEDILGILS